MAGHRMFLWTNATIIDGPNKGNHGRTADTFTPPQGRKVALRAGLGAEGIRGLSPSKSGRGWRNSVRKDKPDALKNFVGFALQFAALAFLPLLIIWQLTFGFGLLWMPALMLAAMAIFYVGHSLRDFHDRA